MRGSRGVACSRGVAWGRVLLWGRVIAWGRMGAHSNLSVNDTLFDENDLERCFSKIEAIDFHQTVELEGIKFYCHHAGHVLGGSMFNIEIAGVKVCQHCGATRQGPGWVAA